EGCEEFQDLEGASSRRPPRSWCPTNAEPSPPLVQLAQVVSPFSAGNARPSPCDPVRMSWWLGFSRRLLTVAPFSVSAVWALMFGLSCRSLRSFATTTPFEFFHGPRPMRSRALTAGWPPAAVVLRYARQLRSPAPASCG